MKQTPRKREMFDGTAYYYLKYRGQYSKKLIDIIADTCQLNGHGRLLDLGCGTGKLTFPLVRYFEEAVGIDISSDMLQSAQSQCELLGINNLIWEKRSSETIGEEMGEFRLITAGDAFHWMDREKVLKLSYDRLSPGGAIALVGQGHLLGDHHLPWQRAVQEVIDQWFEKSDWDDEISGRSYEALLKQFPFQKVSAGNIQSSRKRDIKSIIGYLYSTSTCNKRNLGDRSQAFEKEINEALKAIDPSGIYEEPVTDYYIIGVKGT